MSQYLKIIKISLWITLVITIVTKLLGWNEEFIWQNELEYIVIYFIFSLVLTAVNISYSEFIAKKYSWSGQPKMRLIIGSVGTLIIVLAVYGLVRTAFFMGYEGMSLEQFLNNETSQPYWLFGGISLVASLFLHAFYFYKRLARK